MLPAIQNFGRFADGVGRAFAAPAEERADRRRKQESENLAAQQAQTAQQQLETQRQQGQLNVEQRTQALPVSTQEALATQGVVEQARASDHDRAIDSNRVQGQEVRSTIDTATDGRVRIIDATAQGDRAKFEGWNDTIGPRQDARIRAQHDQELALANLFVGSMPQSERLSMELQNDRDMAERMQERQMPLDWVKAATQGAATLGTLFL